jgi:sporulation inhibitor KapD
MELVKVSGRIICFNEEERVMKIRVKNRIDSFYLQRSMINKIGKYLTINRFIQFQINPVPRRYHHFKVYDVENVLKIMAIRFRKNIKYYDFKDVKQGTRDLVNSLNTKMFLDLEMSMHPYKVDKTFKQEIIQAGIHLVDKDGHIIYKYNQFIKPTLFPRITKRTIKFLKITQEEVDNGITFQEFYKVFSRLIDRYNPAIIVWGRNDFLSLREAYKINKLPSLHKKTRYINLLKLHKNYFNLKNDLGLFNALRLYQEAPDNQVHNAYEDAYVTSLIFKGFKRLVNKEITVDLGEYK